MTPTRLQPLGVWSPPIGTVMATFKAYPGGATCGIGNPSPSGGARGQIQGWSRGAARRNTAWLYSIQTEQLDGYGDAVTLTMLDIPPTSDEWARLLKNFLDRLRRSQAIIRFHWVVEWQRRGAPHLHLAVYSGSPIRDTASGPGHLVVAAWLEVAAAYRPARRAQWVIPISGAEGWLQYLSKHAARGVSHYQRQGMPSGWTKTGHLWGKSKSGTWPIVDPVHGELTVPQLWKVRRMVRHHAVAAARSEALRYERLGKREKAAGAWRRVAYLRRMHKDGERGRSAVRGFSEWVPGDVLLLMAEWAGWRGELAQLAVPR